MNTEDILNTEDLSQSAREELELADIPYGEIFVLTNPETGLTSIDLRRLDAITLVAHRFKKPCILHSKDVMDSRLWHCFVCRMNNEQLWAADDTTLLEMLCTFWQLDANHVSDYLGPRWYHYLFWRKDDERQPMKISVKPYYPTKGIIYGDDSISMGFRQTNYSREKSLGDIRAILQDNHDYNLGISMDDIIAIQQEIQNKSQNNTQDYTLEIEVRTRPIFEKGKDIRLHGIKSCDIVLIDNTGVRHNLKLTVYSKALYLTFMTYKEGKTIREISKDDVFHKRFQEIYRRLPYASMSNIPDTFDVLKDDQYLLFTQKLGEIRKAIMDTTHSNKVRELYGVEGYKGEAFSVKGATDEQRAFVMDTFELE